MSGKPLLPFGSSESLHKSASTSSLSGRRGFQLPPPVQMRDWRNALRSQPSYKIGNRTFTFRLPNSLVLVMALLLILLIFFYLFHPSSKFGGHALRSDSSFGNSIYKYNSTYPMTAPVLEGGHPTYRIALIADLDTNSKSQKSGYTWVSYLKLGRLSYNRASSAVDVTWEPSEAVELSSHFALKGERMIHLNFVV